MATNRALCGGALAVRPRRSRSRNAAFVPPSTNPLSVGLVSPDMSRASPSGRASRASPQAPAGLDHPATIPDAEGEWHLVCITRKGKVSMLKNLDLRTARETYKRLLPSTYPVDHRFCEICDKESGGSWSWGGGYCSSSDSDRLEKVEALGPEGVKLDPWHGVAPRVIFHCRVGEPRWNSRGEMIGRVPEHPKPEPKWDASRADFWNNPKLWDGIDPTKKKCWQERCK